MFDKKNIKKSEWIMKVLRQALSYDENDSSHDDDILNTYSKDELFDMVLVWEGIIGYSYRIKEWVKEIYGLEVK